jgi:hypothetical protein
LRIHVSPARCGRVQGWSGERSEAPQPAITSLLAAASATPCFPSGAAQGLPRPHRYLEETGPGYARPETAVSPNRNPRLRLPRWQQGSSCHDASASCPLDDFLRQTSVPGGPGTRTLRRYRNDLGLEVRNDRYSVLRSRGGVRGEGADAQLRRRRSSLSPPRSQGAPQSGGRRLGRCLTPN